MKQPWPFRKPLPKPAEPDYIVNYHLWVKPQRWTPDYVQSLYLGTNLDDAVQTLRKTLLHVHRAEIRCEIIMLQPYE